MNEVSIIINGVRYDAVQLSHDNGCDDCDLYNIMGNINVDNYIGCICSHFNFGYNICFKKSTKHFEK